MKEKIIFCWSGGKDFALALNRILHDTRYEVATLLMTRNEHFQTQRKRWAPPPGDFDALIAVIGVRRDAQLSRETGCNIIRPDQSEANA
jgi:hypothetical protein